MKTVVYNVVVVFGIIFASIFGITACTPSNSVTETPRGNAVVGFADMEYDDQTKIVDSMERELQKNAQHPLIAKALAEAQAGCGSNLECVYLELREVYEMAMAGRLAPTAVKTFSLEDIPETRPEDVDEWEPSDIETMVRNGQLTSEDLREMHQENMKFLLKTVVVLQNSDPAPLTRPEAKKIVDWLMKAEGVMRECQQDQLCRFEISQDLVDQVQVAYWDKVEAYRTAGKADVRAKAAALRLE